MIHFTRNNSQKRFNFLPSHFVIKICSYLDNESQLCALIAFDKWTYAFASSTKLMDNFYLDLNNEFFNRHRIQDLPNSPIRNVTITIDKEDLRPSFYLRTLKKYNASIVNVEFSKMSVKTPNFVKLLDAVKNNVIHLVLDRVIIDDVDHPFELPDLKSLKIITSNCYNSCGYDIMKRWMINFKNNQSIEKLHLDGSGEMCYWSPNDINSFITTLPNVKHLTIKHLGWGQPLDENFPAKLETFEISHFYNNSIGFLRTQMETLLDLKISYFSYDYMKYMMTDTLRMIFNQMKLRNFQCKNDKLITNYERQPEPMQIDNNSSDDDDSSQNPSDYSDYYDSNDEL